MERLARTSQAVSSASWRPAARSVTSPAKSGLLRYCSSRRAAACAAWSEMGSVMYSSPPMRMLYPPRMDREAKFWGYVNKTPRCWLWTGCTVGCGYGQFWDGRRKVQAHRYAYQARHGPLPPGKVLD